MSPPGRLPGVELDSMTERRDSRWHELLGQIGVELLRRPSLQYFLFSLLATLVAKLLWFGSENDVAGNPLSLVASDMLLLGTLALASLALENLWAPARLLTGLLFAAVTFLAMANAGWLLATGGQITSSVFSVLLENPRQSISVAMESPGTIGQFFLLVALLVVPLPLAHLGKRLHGRVGDPALHRWGRWSPAVLPGLVLLVALGTLTLVSMPRAPAFRSAARNVHQNLLLRGLKGSGHKGPKEAKVPVVLTNAVSSQQTRPNVVVILLESCSWLRSSFGEPEADRSPFLRQLAAEGLMAKSMRAVLPHTTKAVFSALCGTYPSMERALVEVADNYASRCLPQVLKELDYRTAFFQSANGVFEMRPRLVERLGFTEYRARQDMGLEAVSFIRGDDFGMIAPALDWVRQGKGPFMLTLLTSITHMPYTAPSQKGKLPCDEDSKECQQKNYERSYSLLDEFTREVVEGLRRAGVLDQTILVVAGDHGEGFGEHGQWCHDNTYHEEGLKVPFVMRAPGLIEPGTVVEEPRAMIDIMPTVLSLLDVPYEPESLDGISLLEAQDPDEKRYFSCWYDGYCAGYVQGDRKLIYVPNEDTYFSFDLARDPGELEPNLEDPALKPDVQELQAWIDRHRGLVKEAEFSERMLFGYWDCKKRRCGIDPEAYAAHRIARFQHQEGDGLLGRYYDNRNFHGKSSETRLDPIVDFDWAYKGPMKGIHKDDFSVAWEGCLKVEEGESPRLAAGSEDGMLVYVDGKLAIDNSGRHNYRVKLSEPLQAGIHPLRVEYTEVIKYAQAFLGWSLDGEKPEAVPPYRLSPPGGNERIPCPARIPAPQDGITGFYFAGPGFQGKSVQRIDRSVDFAWNGQSPLEDLPAGGFSIRWEGCLLVEEDQEDPRVLSIRPASGDGVEVHLDGELVMSKQPGEKKKKKLVYAHALEPGLKHLEVRYQAGTKKPKVQLAWYEQVKGKKKRKLDDYTPVWPVQLVPLGGNYLHRCTSPQPPSEKTRAERTEPKMPKEQPRRGTSGKEG